MTILESIRNYFCACPLLKEGALNVDYLDNGFNYNIDSIPTNPILQKYADGGAKKQFTFIFQSREAWGNDTLSNLDNNGFYEQLGEWIEKNNKNKFLPTMEEGKIPFKVQLLTCGYLMSNTADSGIYQIQARLIYLEL